MDAGKKLDVGHAITVGPCLYQCERTIDWLQVQLGANGPVDTAIGTVRNGKLRGAFGFNQYHPDDGTISIHIAGRWGWLTREALAQAFLYCFDQLDCERITGTIVASNKASLQLARSVGFVKEGRMKKAHRRKEDVLVMRLTQKQWRKSERFIELPELDIVPVIWHYKDGELQVIPSEQRQAENTRRAGSDSSRAAASAI